MKTKKVDQFIHKQNRSGVYDDGTLALYSGDIQLLSLITFMGEQGYTLVYSDSSVFFRNNEKVSISFENACKMHNSNQSINKVVHIVKMQRSRSNLKTLCNKIQFTPSATLTYNKTALFVSLRIGKFPTLFEYWKFVASTLLVQKD